MKIVQIFVLETYIQTTFLIDELINLSHDTSGGLIKVKERPGMRKDRYSSLSYNYYVAIQLENKMSKKANNGVGISDSFIIKPPHSRKAVKGASVFR